MSNGKVIGIVGEMGAGKTSYIKKYSARVRADQTYCYLKISSDWEDKKIHKFTNFTLFIRTANTKKDKLFIIDEAYTCLPAKLNIKIDKPEDVHNQLADFLVNSRKLNNFVFIILHSLSQVPTWLIPYLDYFVRFTTKDMIQYQKQRFSSYPEIANNLADHPIVSKYKPFKLKLR